MHLFRVIHLALSLMAVLLATASCTSRRTAHLDDAKAAIVDYYEGGAWEREVERQAAKARALILALPMQDAPGALRAPVILLDIDDTAISTWAYQKRVGLGFHYPTLQEWRREATAPALKPILELYHLARARGCEVIFLTGRREDSRADTEATLRAAGYHDWDALLMRPTEWRDSSAAYKTQTRRQLTEAGKSIYLSIGDQQSDLDGGYARHTIKLPNQIYRVD